MCENGSPTKPAYIYSLTDPRNDAIRYIGKTVNPDVRKSKHKNGYHPSTRAWAAELTALGLEPLFAIIEITDHDKWDDREVYWIAYGRSMGWALLNCDEGGRGGRNPLPSTRERMRNSHLGKTQSPESRKKLSESITGRKMGPSPRKGKPNSWGHKISAGKMGHVTTETAKQKMSEKRLAYWDNKGRHLDRAIEYLKAHPDAQYDSCRATARVLGIKHCVVADAKRKLGIPV